MTARVLAWFLPLLLMSGSLFGQAITVAGVDLHLGMARSAVLEKYALQSNLKVLRQENGHYTVGDNTLVFVADKLAWIIMEGPSSNDQSARTVAKAFYNAVVAANNAGPPLSVSADTANGLDTIHLLFSDREVVFMSLTGPGIQMTWVSTCYPRMMPLKR